MIRLFRKIRNQLLSEERYSVYILYASGEIILVVVGILLALQIDNWNEISQNRTKQIEILKNLETEFFENKRRYEETIIVQERTVNYGYKLIEYMGTKSLEDKKDSISRFIIYGALSFYKAEPLTGTYQTIIGSGEINFLENDQLKMKLAEFSAELTNGFEDEAASMSLFNHLFADLNEIAEFTLTNSVATDLGLSGWPKENERSKEAGIKKLYDSNKVVVPLTFRMRLETNRLNRQKKMLKYSEEILDLINIELQSS